MGVTWTRGSTGDTFPYFSMASKCMNVELELVPLNFADNSYAFVDKKLELNVQRLST